MKPIEVGCIVEVSNTRLEKHAHWIGRQLVVLEVGVRARRPRQHGGGYRLGVRTSPHPQGTGPWGLWQLRRVDPPDWQAPILKTETLDDHA